MTSDREGGPRPGGQASRAARAQFAAQVPAAGPDGPAQVPAAGAVPDRGGQPQRWHSYADARTVVVRDILRSVISGLVAQTGRGRVDIIDAGGGTGGFAVPLAGQGHTVTVIDPSPDSLAAAQRRAAEMAVPLRAIQGDATDLAALVGTEGADLVLCHSVLEYVDAPAAAMTAVASVLRPAGAVSVLASSAVAAVLHRAQAGRFDEARRLLAAVRAPGAAAGETGPGVTGPPAAAGSSAPRRFTLAEVVGLIEEAGLRPGAAHGVRVFSDLVPGSFADADPGAADALLALEQAASTHPAFHDVAAQFHVLGYR